MIKNIIAVFKNLNNAHQHNKMVRTTMKELQALSNKELNDIGITRGEIYDIAHSSHARPTKIVVEHNDIQVNSNLKGFV